MYMSSKKYLSKKLLNQASMVFCCTRIFEKQGNEWLENFNDNMLYSPTFPIRTYTNEEFYNRLLETESFNDTDWFVEIKDKRYYLKKHNDRAMRW